MTKSIQITFSDADESFLMTLFKKLKVKTKKIETQSDDYVEQTKEEILNDLKQAVEEMKAIERGEIKGINLEEMMAEIRADNVKMGRPKPKKSTLV